MKYTVLNLLFISIISLISCQEPVDDQLIDPSEQDTTREEVSYKEKAKAVYDFIQNNYRAGDLYRENYPAQGGDNKYCYLWPYVGMLTAGNVLHELGYDRSIHDREFNGLELFYDAREELPGYQAYPIIEVKSDHYYDDNCIVAMELIDAYRLLGEQKFLDRAVAITEFIMSGEDSRMGGGLYWLEAVAEDCTSGPNCIKAANTTAYAAFVTSELYKETGEDRYLDFAKRTYEWNYNTLRDPSDDLYWNDINIGTNQINPVKWTYNAAMMIMSGVNLYEITGEQSYLDESITTARSSFSKFTAVREDQLFFPANDPWFNTELMTSYIKLSAHDEKSEEYIEVFIKSADYAWENARTEEGHFYEDWSGNNQGRYYWLLHQACMIEVFGRAAIFRGE